MSGASRHPRSVAGRAKLVLEDIAKQHLEVDPSTNPTGLTAILEKAKGTAHEPHVRQLLDIIGGERKVKFETALQAVLDKGLYPKAQTIHYEKQCREWPDAEIDQLGCADTLDGDQARWRREYLLARGWTESKGRWHPPGSS